MPRILTPLLLTALGLLASCTTLNPITLARLAMLDPLSVDPGKIAVSLLLPEGLGILPGGAALAMGMTNKISGASSLDHFTLAQTGTDRGDVFRIEQADLERMRAYQARARDWKARYGDAAEGSLSLGLEICRAGRGPVPGAKVSARISLDGGDSFLPLMAPTQVAALVAAPEATDVARLPQCPS